MSEKEHFKILVIESDEKLQTRIKNLLSSQGCLVTCFKSSSAALSELAGMDPLSCALAIVSYKMPEMKGDEILRKIREISSDTRRILIADALSRDIIVQAINTAEINSCLSLPFEDQDLINQARHACMQFKEIKKKQNLQRVTQHQNKQLYKIAKQFKEKEEKNIEKIEKKKKEIRLLESKVKHDVSIKHTFSLKDLIKDKSLALTSKNFGAEFLFLQKQIKQILERASEKFIGLDKFKLDDILYETIRDELAKTDDINKDSVKKILDLTFMFLKKTAFLGIDALSVVQGQSLESGVFKLTISDDKMEALIELKNFKHKKITIAQMRDFLEDNGVRAGIKDDEAIMAWLSDVDGMGDSFVIAKGRKPKKPRHAKINYHFPIEFRSPGKVDKDGRIDFKERGNVPFVEKDTFLAAKIFPAPGAPGMDVTGEMIAVEDPVDMAFGAGSGARMSDDGVKIYADIDGQPNLDPLGNVSVFPELKIDSDIGFETGNIEFDGNIIVNGILKEGFSVKGASLTVEQIQGAKVDLTGELNVSSGIVDATLIKVKGNIQAKYINNSKIYGFGDLSIQKEILDSEIRLSGACNNEKGTIISSDISAKMGIIAGGIGTHGSRPSRLKVGVDDHTNFLIAKIDSELKINIDTILVLQNEIDILNKEDQDLHLKISEHAYTQDRTQIKLKDVKKKKFDLQASGNVAALQKVLELEEKMKLQAKEAEDKINEGFERQDTLAQEISQKKERINQFEGKNQVLVKEKKKLEEFTEKKLPLAEVKVLKKVMSGTKIKGPNAFVAIKDPVSKCRIMELNHYDEGSDVLGYYEMVITDL